MQHWTQVLTNIALVEFVLLAALTTLQWVRHRIRGAGWVALTFALLGGISLLVKYDLSLLEHPIALKTLIALILVVPYCLFRFAASFRQPSLAVRTGALAKTFGIVVFTYTLSNLPSPLAPPPPHWLAFRVSFLVEFTVLFAYVVVRLFMAGAGEPPVAAYRMRLLAVAVAGFQVQVVVAALQLQGATIDLVTEAITVAMGILFLAALVLPSFIRVALSRRADVAFRQAVGELVSASDSRDVGDRLLPHVCALVGASKAALLTSDGIVVARYPRGSNADGTNEWGAGDDEQRRIIVRTHRGPTHVLAVKISRYMPYFGSEELHKLDELASMVGLAIERCEMVEQVAFQASHDSLTGLANRTLFMQRLDEALHHVGRRSASVALIFIDLDRFKLVNDRADHSAGDVVLQEMAKRMTAMTRGVDLVARFGGDEFVAFAEVDHEDDALEMAERIRRGLSEPIQLGDVQLVVTSSIGVVLTSDGTSPAALLLRDADNAMYDAKRAGRDQVIMYRTNA
ncbi:MAG TPA: GGDEF domain-containing protein, partial [Acidimicrobiales bacterium]|nr:GGDEF domain-containing protein [Acidimicrobiales bacterium]